MEVKIKSKIYIYFISNIIFDLIFFFSALPINTPLCDLTPAPWWDREADRSLLVGTYKHGFESYNQMRSDPALSFLAKCGPPSL